MRITSGEFGGRSLFTPKGKNTRPTTDRARQAVFNILCHAHWAPAIAEARVLDLFAGSGALGFEALSLGASFCLFVEQAAEARAAIRDNIEAFNLFGQTRIHRRSAISLGRRPPSTGEPFDLVFLDPPYGEGLGEKALAELVRYHWLATDALLVFECSAEETPSLPNFTVLETRIYGAAKILFLQQRRVL
ncbi:MAG: 16S rRNA (guanine(966)-N(2))-methyltransferase RsmD [Robiginitomaculum sp.]|nr:16S rRNA (guanine(966)-N(2))-methyltransferase RsmD [Robiginitomaculum sp.]